MLLFTTKTVQTDKMTDNFYQAAHLYLQNELPQILRTDKDLSLTSLSGGIVGTTYKFIHPETQRPLVVKVEDFEEVAYDALLASDVSKTHNIPYPNLLYFDCPDYQGAKLSVKIFESINLPIYSEFLKKNPTAVEGIIHLGQTVRKIHQKETQGYGKLKNKSFIAKHDNPISYLKRIYLQKEYEDFYINGNYFTIDEIQRIYEALHRPDLFRGRKPVFCHGDIHLSNCFYNPDEKSVILFDYSCKSMPAEFDLSIYKYKTLFKIPQATERLFRQGYGQTDINEDLVNILFLYQIFSKGVLWIREGKVDKGNFVVNTLKEKLL